MKTKKLLALLLALVMTISMFAGCGAKEEEAAPAPEAETEAEAEAPVEEEAQPEKETAPEAEEPEEPAEEAPAVELKIKNAKNFAIDYMEDSVKLLTDSDGNKLLLVPEGVEAPAGYEDAVQVTTPLKRAIYTSTTHVGYLGALEDDSLYDSIVGVTTAQEDWTTPQVLERFENGQITYVQQDHWNAGDIETITELNPDFVFSGGGDESGVQLRSMLDEVGIKYAVVTEWTEANSAASLEWIKFFAAFFNLDEEAAMIYDAKLARMDELYAQMESVPEEDRPTVAYGQLFDGIVYTQAGGSTFAQEIAKAGGKYAMADVDGEGSLQLGMEEFLDKCKDADIIIYSSLPQYTPDLDYLVEMDPLFAEFAAYKNQQIYNLDQGYYMNADKVVEKFEDLVAMCHPEMMEGHEFTMYHLMPQTAEPAAE